MRRFTNAGRPWHPTRRSMIAVMIFTLISLLSACSTPGPMLMGTVRDAYTGEVLQAAQVRIGGQSLSTDTNGIFQTQRWQSSDTMAISAPDYEPLSLPLAEHPQVAQSNSMTVTLETSLRPNILRGVVRDAYTDAPVAGAELMITLNVSNTLVVSSTLEGGYRMTGVPEQFTLEVRAPDYAPYTQTVSRTTNLDLSLRPNVLSGQVTDRFSGLPVAGATVRVGEAQATTDAEGNYRVAEIAAGEQTVEISADGYAPLSEEIGQTTVLNSVLRPDTLRGRLVDQETGEPIANATIIAMPNLPGTAVAYAQIQNSSDGSFTLKGVPEQGYIQVLSPGYAKKVLEISPGNLPAEIGMERFVVRALYVTAAIARKPHLLQEYIDLIDTTELNAIVIDIKSDLRDDLGLVYYDSQVPMVQELGLSYPYIEIEPILAQLKEKGIYSIARIQLFSHDNMLSNAHPEWSIRLKETGEVYADYPGPGIRYAYLDPTNRNVWDYNIQLGIEAAMLGFDEVNYDYIRFPDWYDDAANFRDTLLFSEPIDPVENPDRMYEVLTEFMELAHREVNEAGAYMSIDVFGRVMLGPSMTIAQDIGRMGAYCDYIAPMAYPSLWAPGAFGLDSPVDQPYEVLDASNAAGIEQIRGRYARLRPWLQDHTDPWAYKVVEYGPEELRAQIDASEKYPEIDGWMLYDSANVYRGAFNGAVRPEK